MGGWANRPTVDVDVVAFAEPSGLVKARPMPPELAEAIADVAVVRGLPPEWMNPGPADLMDWGLPNGFLDRASHEQYGGLTVLIAGRIDLIGTKLYAAVDQGPTGRHAVMRDVLRDFGIEDDAH